MGYFMVNIQEIREDSLKRNHFIEAYKPFVATVVYQILGKRVEYGVDDELQIALIGFNHAIDKFDGRGSFFSFAKLIIRNRIYDYYRLNKKHLNNEPIIDADDNENFKVSEVAFKKAEIDEYAFDLRQEIEMLAKDLKKYNINFLELVKISPKHKNKRKVINDVVSFLLNNEEAMKYFHATKNIPLKLVEDGLSISRKNIEPYRKYIIALLVISESHCYYLKEYLEK